MLCDVVPMNACHLLLGRPWQFYRKAHHDGFTNRHVFTFQGKTITLCPMTPLQVVEQYEKSKAREEEKSKAKGKEKSKAPTTTTTTLATRERVLMASKAELEEECLPHDTRLMLLVKMRHFTLTLDEESLA